VLPVVAILAGEYGQHDMAMGVPCVLTRQGVEQVLVLEFDKEEKELFETSVQMVRKDLDKIPEL
jgi:malate/lactate dehydrogenase